MNNFNANTQFIKYEFYQIDIKNWIYILDYYKCYLI